MDRITGETEGGGYFAPLSRIGCQANSRRNRTLAELSKNYKEATTALTNAARDADASMNKFTAEEWRAKAFVLKLAEIGHHYMAQQLRESAALLRHSGKEPKGGDGLW